MIASLPMYDRPEARGATDRFWQAIRASLGAGPETLTRTGDIWDHWLDPELVFSQTCGYPYRARLHGRVALAGTPDYGLQGCPPGYYNSVFVARADDPRDQPAAFGGARFAYNEALSQSGWAAPRVYAQAKGFDFGDLLETGGHGASARAVAEERADLAALDALSWKMMQRHDGFAAGLKEIGRTVPTPALPYITAMTRDAAEVFAAVAAAIGALDEADSDMLSLKGVVRIPAGDYLAVPTPPGPGED